MWPMTLLTFLEARTLISKISGLQTVQAKLVVPHHLPLLAMGKCLKHPATIQRMFGRLAGYAGFFHVGCIRLKGNSFLGNRHWAFLLAFPSSVFHCASSGVQEFQQN